MKYDVIIIGSGLGGLECGTMLSRQGRSVLILERQLQPGGCLQSYKRDGISFDTGLHYVGGIAEGQPLHDTFKTLGLLDLPWQRLDSNGFDLITIGDETFPFHEGYDNFVRNLSDRFPTQKQALQEYADLLRKSDEQQLVTLANPTQEETAFQERLLTTNAYNWLKEQFNDNLLINVLSGSSLKTELRKDSLPLLSFLHSNGSFIQSSWRLKGCGNMLVSKLIENINANGGKVLCGMNVTELKEENGKIVAAMCSNGERFEADMFISNIHPTITCSLIKDSTAIKGVYKKRMARLDNTFGMFTASLKLKPGVIPYFNHNKFIYAKPNVWDMQEDGNKDYKVLISCPYSPTGYATHIDILTPMSWIDCEKWADTTVGHRGEDYKALKSNKAEELIAIAEKHVPGLREAVMSCHTSTPLTYRDYNLTPNGSAYGIRKDCNNPLMTFLTPRTPVPNLFLTGQNLMLHGLHGVTMTALYTYKAIQQL